MILFADLATKTGIADGDGETVPRLRTFDFNALAVEYGMKRTITGTLEPGVLYAVAHRVFNQVIDEVKPRWMIFESPVLHGLTQIATVRKLGGLAFLFEGMAIERGIEIYEEQNGAIKLELSGYGKADKDFQIIAARIMGMDPPDDNAADAGGGWLCSVKKLRPDVYDRVWKARRETTFWLSNKRDAEVAGLLKSRAARAKRRGVPKPLL